VDVKNEDTKWLFFHFFFPFLTLWFSFYISCSPGILFGWGERQHEWHGKSVTAHAGGAFSLKLELELLFVHLVASFCECYGAGL